MPGVAEFFKDIIKEHWIEIYTRLRKYSVYPHFLESSGPPCPFTTQRPSFEKITTYAQKAENLGSEIPWNTHFLGYQLWVSSTVHVVILGEQ